MASGLKVIAALGAIAAGAAAIFAFKKHKELENYDYEDLDEDFDDCCSLTSFQPSWAYPKTRSSTL